MTQIHTIDFGKENQTKAREKNILGRINIEI